MNVEKFTGSPYQEWRIDIPTQTAPVTLPAMRVVEKLNRHERRARASRQRRGLP